MEPEPEPGGDDDVLDDGDADRAATAAATASQRGDLGAPPAGDACLGPRRAVGDAPGDGGFGAARPGAAGFIRGCDGTRRTLGAAR